MKIIIFCSCILSIFLINNSTSLHGQEDFPPPPPLESSAPPPAPSTAPAGPEVKSEQLKWPDTIELSETQTDLAQTSNKAVLALFSNSKKITQDTNEQLNKMSKSYEDFSKKFDDINSQIDSFLQETAFLEGKAKEQTSPSLPK